MTQLCLTVSIAKYTNSLLSDSVFHKEAFKLKINKHCINYYFKIAERNKEGYECAPSKSILASVQQIYKNLCKRFWFSHTQNLITTFYTEDPIWIFVLVFESGVDS